MNKSMSSAVTYKNEDQQSEKKDSFPQYIIKFRVDSASINSTENVNIVSPDKYYTVIFYASKRF